MQEAKRKDVELASGMPQARSTIMKESFCPHSQSNISNVIQDEREEATYFIDDEADSSSTFDALDEFPHIEVNNEK